MEREVYLGEWTIMTIKRSFEIYDEYKKKWSRKSLKINNQEISKLYSNYVKKLTLNNSKNLLG